MLGRGLASTEEGEEPDMVPMFVQTLLHHFTGVGEMVGMAALPEI